ncbi:hypothetical protein GQL56_03410 [Pseudomonas putida]|nr:hypothetical protein [Pseudomonas putida]
MHGKNQTGQGSPGSDPEVDKDRQTLANDSLVQSTADDRDDYIDPDIIPEAESVPAKKPSASNAPRFSRYSDGPDTPWKSAWLH